MMKLILLPGMDGTGKLFEDFSKLLSTTYEIEVVQYPSNECRSYSELECFVQSAIPVSTPFVIVAESFSSPLAVLCAARRPSNLKGLVICAGFVCSPVGGWCRYMFLHLTPILFSRRLPDLAVGLFLTGRNASPALLAAVRSTISSVKLEVLADRLRTILECDVRAELVKIDIPILYLRAKQDRLIRPVCLQEIQRIRPQVMVKEIQGPHLLLQREPERAVEALKAFMQQIPR
jgi:pimeloyl-ACP methyl ester carboxylesterase